MTYGRRVYRIVAQFLFLKTNLLKTGLIISILAIILVFVNTPSASNVSITNSQTQAKLGIYMQSYYENANAQLSSSPISVNTQTTTPANSGQFYLKPGTSAYLWTTQYQSSKTLPAGKMTIDLWAGSTPIIDGQVSIGSSGKTGTVSLTTTQANDLIYVVVATQSTPTVNVSGSGLTWQTRASIANGGIGKLWTFYAIAPTPLSSSAITATLSASQKFVIIAFGVSGVNTAQPFDVDNPATASGNDKAPTVTLTKSSTNDLVIGSVYVNNIATVTAGTEFSTIAAVSSTTSTLGACESLNSPSPGLQTVGYSLNAKKTWAIIGDAIVPASYGGTLSASAYTITSAGAIQSVLFSGLNTSPITSTNQQVATVFPVNAGIIPTSGYVEIVLTAPTSNGVYIQWGNQKPTNIQLALTYG